MITTFAGRIGELHPDIVMPAKIRTGLPPQEFEAPLSEAEINEMFRTDFEQADDETSAEIEGHPEPGSEDHKGYA